MAVAPQTAKCHENWGTASVLVTFGRLWCHSQGLKLGMNFFQYTTVPFHVQWYAMQAQGFGMET